MLLISPEETKTIRAIQERGHATLPNLARDLQMHRSTLHYQLQSLVHKGVLEEVKVSTRRVIYRVAETSRLQKVIAEQQRALTELLLDSPRSTVAGKKPKLVFCDWYVLSKEALDQLSDYEVVSYPDSPVRISPEAFILRCSDADVVVTFFSVAIDKQMLMKCPRLKCIVTASITTEMVDVEACRELGIEVRSLTPYEYYKKAARTEFVFASLFHVLRPLYPAAEALRLGQFDYRGFVSEELHGKTVGVVGVKREGREIIPLLRAFGCGVMVCDPDQTSLPPGDLGVAAYTPLSELFHSCDVVIFPEDLNAMVELGPNLMNRKMRAKYFLFLSYSLDLDVDLLRELIISRDIIAIALDYFADAVGIFNNFPASKYRKIMNFPNVVITPELGFYTKQSMARNNQEVLAILKQLKLGRSAR